MKEDEIMELFDGKRVVVTDPSLFAGAITSGEKFKVEGRYHEVEERGKSFGDNRKVMKLRNIDNLPGLVQAIYVEVAHKHLRILE